MTLTLHQIFRATKFQYLLEVSLEPYARSSFTDELRPVTHSSKCPMCECHMVRQHGMS